MRAAAVMLTAGLLAGCGGLEPVETVREPVTLPAWMTEPCPETPVRIRVIGDFPVMLEMVEAERNECAARMRDVIEWSEDVEG